MKKYLLLGGGILSILLIIALRQQPDATAAPNTAALCEISNSSWVKGPSIPGNHMEAASAVVGGKFYVISGFSDSSLNLTTRVDVYNPATNQWETATRPRKGAPVAFSHAQAAADERYIWVAGGFIGKQPGQPTDRVWRYDTVNDSWSELPKLPQKRAAGAVILENRTLHYVGGTAIDRDTSYGDHWTLNLDNTSAGWQTSSPMPNKRIHSSGAFLNGLFYTLGGQYKHDHDPQDLSLVHAFNVSTKTWSQKASLPFPRSHFEPATMIIGGQVVIIGGRANQNGFGNGQIVNVTAYNPQTNSWKELRQLPLNLIATNAGFIGNKIIVAGGGVNWNTITRNMYTSTVTLSNCAGGATSTPVPPTAVVNTAMPTTAVPTTEVPTQGPSATNLPATETPVPPTPTPTTSSSTGQAVVSFTLIDAQRDVGIRTIVNGDVIDLSELGTNQITIRANTEPSNVGSVVFGLDSTPRYRVESGAPYALSSNSGSNYEPWSYTLGQHTLMGTPYTLSSGNGLPGTPLTVTFTIVTESNFRVTNTFTPIPSTATLTPVPPTAVPTNTMFPPTATLIPPTNVPGTATQTPTSVPPTAVPSQMVARFVLVNAQTDRDIGQLDNNALIDCSVIGTNKLTIRAETEPWKVGSVVFGLNSNSRYRVENGDPYTLANNNGQDYFAWSLTNGTYNLRATPYTSSNGYGTAGTGLQINTVLKNC
jgi:N-acetylneuraminic acid mutarotase